MNDIEMPSVHAYDDWDRHWSSLDETAQINPAQRYRQRLLQLIVRRELSLRPQVRTVMDFGSGQGDLIRLIAPIAAGRRLIGLELSRVGVVIAATKTPQAAFYQVDLVADVPSHVELHGQGDLCLCSEVIEHLDDPGGFLRHARRYMTPGSTLIVTVPSGPMNAFEKSIGHRRHFTPEAISRLLSDAGLQVLKVERAGFPFFNLYKIGAYLMGDRIRMDGEAGSGGAQPSGIMALVLKTFGILFRFNLRNAPFGWQLVVTAQNPSREVRSC